MQRTTLMGTQWSRISCSVFVAHIHRDSKEMEHNQTRGLWSLLQITKWNYYLPGTNITVKNDHKPLTWFLNGKNPNNKVNRWSLELATYNITFEWISGAKNKVADCLSQLVKPTSTSTSVNMLTASHAEGPTFNTRSHTQHTSPSTTSTPHPDISPKSFQETNPTPKPLTVDRLEALPQMQRTNPFCKHISK